MRYLRTNLGNPSSIHIMIKQMILLLLCSGISSATDKLASCDFETDFCGWTKEEGLNSSHSFEFTRQTGQDFIGEFTDGPKTDHNMVKNTYFLYANVSYGEPETETAITSPVVSAGIFCFKFWFDMKHFGGIRAMNVFIKLPSGLLIPKWEYQNHVETWTVAQVRVDWFAEPFQLVITGVRGGSMQGYIAMDDFDAVYTNEECSIQPPDAEPKFTTPKPTNQASTTTHHPKDIGCSFDFDMCGYHITGDNGFEFSRKNGENFQNDPQHGPAMDENESTTAYFVHISAAQVQAPVKDDLAVSEIQIPMIQAKDHMIECFHFWFAMKRDGTIRTISIVQQDEEGENNAGAVKIIWNYHSSQVDNEDWLEGQVEVRADAVADVYQNYTLRIVAERNGVSEDWAALDAFTFSRNSECMMKPSGAEPASTTPLPSPTPGNNTDLYCDFDTDMCGFKTETGQTDFVFERVQGKDIPSIDYDHNFNIDSYFLYAHDDSGIRDYTWLRSDEFDGEFHRLECFHFWFYVEGFKASNRNFLNITVTYEEAQLPDDFVWSFQSSTEEWMEGQVEIRAKEIDDVPKDFRIFIVADKPEDLVAFLAVDDFVMTGGEDICEYLPPLAPDTTTTSGTTTLPNCDDAFSCDESNTQCIPMKKVCDFNTDCANGRDERECPNIYLFDDCKAETTMQNCGWENRFTDNLEWVIVAKNETDVTNHPIERGGKFFWIRKVREEGNNVAYIHSPMYQESDIQCMLSFYYYIAGDLGNSPIIPALHIFEGDRQVNLDYLSITDKWAPYEISLGRRISAFEVVFMRENSSVFDAGVAIDDVGFNDCGLPRPQETCDGLASFQCANKACIDPDRLCDLSDDCGDKSDEEGLYCDTHTFWQSNFEDDNKPFGMFSPDPDPQTFRWKRGSGETANHGTGPPFDHTTFDVEGHYLYIDSSYDLEHYGFAEIVSEIFVPDPANELECRMIFYYHMTGPNVGALWVSVRYANGQNIPLWEVSGDLGNKWNREVLSIQPNTVHNDDYSIVFKATIGEQYQGDIAIDDVTFSPACRPKNAPSTTTPTPTPDGCPDGFQCNNGNCILNTQVCDFHYDCGDGLEDEAGCPTEYSFEDCSTIEQCGLEQVIPDNLDFVITTGEDIAASEHSGRGPNADYENSTTTHFLYAMPKGPDCCSQDVADIQTHQFQNADVRCLMNFWMYISSGNSNLRVYPYLIHTELGFITRLDRLDTDSLGDAKWTKVQIGIGRHRDPFKLGFSLIQDDGDTKYDTGLAIDEMFMFDCDRLMPSPDGCPENEWQCTISKACIAHTQLCDYSDDCGDGSDEVMFDEICVDFTRTDFENPDQPFGFFNQDDERPEFRWQVGNGSISTEGTGPPFDHTFFSPVGHYLYIASDAHDKDERAWITSPTIDVSTKDCMVRFWYHMHGQGVGNLTIYKQNMKGALEQLWRASGQDGIDENRWRRNLQILQSQEQFKIVIEASVGEKNKGNIAIDDVSFTPACSFVDNPKTTSTATPGTTTKRTTPWKPPTTHTTPWKPPTTHTTPWKPPTTHTTPWEPPTTHWSSTTELIVTPAPSDPHQGSVIIICAVVGAVVVIGLVLIIVVTVYKRGVPSMDSVRSFLNPSYERFGGTSSGDTHMMSLRELTSKEEK